MKNVRLLHGFVLITVVAACSSTSEVRTVGVQPAPHVGLVSARGMALRAGLRELWADHVVWTRDYIIAATSDHPSAQTALDRLMKNQEDLGSAIAPYYGTDAGVKLTTLLKDHIKIAGEVVAAAKAGNNTQLKDADRRWHDNAADIATFLSGANPNWPRADLLAMLNEHLALTTREATARLQRNWEDDRMTFDRIFDQAMMMADALADGILKQFPNAS